MNDEQTSNPFMPSTSLRFASLSWLLAVVVLLSFIEFLPGSLLPYVMYPSFISASAAIVLGKREVSSRVDVRKTKQGIIMGWVLWLMGVGSIILYLIWAFINAGPD